MDESFVQGIVGGVLNRHKDRTLDKKRIQTLMVEIAANIDVANHYTNVKGLAKDNPLSIEMWKGWDGKEEPLTKEYLDYWKCDLCGDHTHEVDYDYLGNGTNHLKCELEYQNEYNAHLDKGKTEQIEIPFPKED